MTVALPCEGMVFRLGYAFLQGYGKVGKKKYYYLVINTE
jgi:hypothetical protein